MQPYILHTFGFVPGIIIICVVAVVTSWADYVVGIFKMQYPEVYSLADVCFIMWGPIGREISGFFFWVSGWVSEADVLARRYSCSWSRACGYIDRIQCC